MKIPLTAFIQKNEEEGNEKLLIYSNGNQIKIDLPFSPFILAEANKFPELTGNTETWTKVPQHTPTDYFRINFRTNKEYYDVIKKYSDRKRYIFNNNYIDQLLISHPDYFLNYPNTNNLKIMYFDIEVVTRGDGYFPRPITNEVLCIGYSIWEYNNIGKKRKIKQDIIKGFNENTKDSNILTNFKQVIINEDPDIIAGYNSESFDFPYLIDRFELMKIDTNGIGRNNRKIYKYKNQIIIPGRIHFDIYNSNAGVTKDQTLCYDQNTEILTENGWKYFNKLLPTEKVATLNQTKNELEYQLPTKIHSYDYSGKMYRVKAKSVDLLVTENHDMYVEYKEDKDKPKWVFKKPNEILNKKYKVKRNVENWNGNNRKTFSIPKIIRKKMEYNYKNKNTFKIEDWLEFFGYYISEGSCYIHEKKGLYNINISQCLKNSNNVNKIRDCIKRLGFSTNYYSNNDSSGNINFKGKQLCQYLKQFGYANEKYIPQKILNLNKRLLKILFDALMLGDGTKAKKKDNGYITTAAYTTTSKKLSDNIQEIGIKLGYAVSESKEIHYYGDRKSTTYRIRLIERQVNPTINSKKIQDEIINYRGKVYCCTVPNNIIMVRRNGYSLWCGNSGIKSKSLKDLARFYKINIEDIELPDEISNLYKLYQENPEKLYSYQNDDVLRTEHVGNVYIRNCITLAEMMGCPLDSIVTMFSSFIPKLIVAREMESLRLINTETNFQKYNSVNGSICQFRKFDGKELKYQGAIVGLYKAGFFENVNKLDFSSQYPSAIQTWNIGPDTVSLVEVRPYTGKYSFAQDSSYNWYVIPDANFNCDIVIKVKNNFDSFLKTKISILKSERKKIKKEQKTCPPEEWEILNSQQNAIKVILNSIYGFFGLKTTSYGDTICGLLVTGLCRWTTTNVMQWLANDLVETDSVVGDTPIYVRDKHSGDINIIPIEDLHRSNLKRKKYSGNYEILTRNGWKNIKYTKKHSVKKDIHRVKISDGYVDVTSDHSLFTTNKKEVAPKNIIVNTTNIETIYNPITSSILPKFDNEFCWLLGFLIAEGSVYEGYTKTGKEKRQVSFNGNNIELMRRVEYLSNKYFNKPEFGNSKFRLHNTMSSSAVYKVQGGYNKIICDWLKENCYTLNRKDKKIPIFILNGTNNMKSSFLDGIMIGDGYNVITKDNRKIESLDSKFKSLSAGIRYLWNSLGHKTICVVRSDKLNITTYRKRVEYKSGKLRNINTNIVLQNNIISKSETVYDVSTDDGTFVTALGNIVLHNTDGLILDKTVNDIDINKKLTDLIKTRFGISENFMQMELENFGRAFFYKTKNYVVEEDGKYIKHGVSMKSSKVSKVVDRAVDLAIEHWFNNKPIEEVIREAYNFKNLGLEWFEERVKLSKEQIEYDDQTDMKLLLAKQMEMKTGQICEQGMQISYFVTKDQLPFKELRDYYKKTSIWNYTFSKYVESIKDLNLAYYEKMIDKALDRFDIYRIEQTDFLSQLDIKKKSKVELDIIPMEKV